MAAIGLPMPSMAPPGPSASPPALHSQSLPQNFSSPNHPSSLSLALPQGGGGGGGPCSNPMPTPLSAAPPTLTPQTSSPLPYPFPTLLEPACSLARIKLLDILPEDGAPSVVYTRAVEGLSSCLAKHGAVIMELNAEDAALVRCALESAKLYFRTRAQTGGSMQSWAGAAWSKLAGYVASPSRDMYYYRAGRHLPGEEVEHPPPCMSDVFRCLGKASRIALGAISRHLGLRSDAFFSLLDDCPLPSDDVSSSVLLATHFHGPGPNMKGPLGGEGLFQETEKGFLALIASDSSGLQVCDPNGRWYLADAGLRPGDLLLTSGRALNHSTAGLRHACAYRVVPLSSSVIPGSIGRTSLTFRLMPRGKATLDGSSVADAGHAVSEGFGPILVSKFMEDLTAADALAGNWSDNALDTKSLATSEPTLRSVLSDPLTGAILEDAYTALGCGHSFGGATLRRVTESQSCTTCGASVDIDRMIPNYALRAAAAAFKREEIRRKLQNASRKRRKEFGEQDERIKRLKENMGSPTDSDSLRHGKGVQYPFSVNERVLIKGNKRTPEKFVGREAVVTSQCLNGWYLLRTLDNGESVRLQYRSLQKCMPDHNRVGEECIQQHSG